MLSVNAVQVRSVGKKTVTEPRVFPTRQIDADSYVWNEGMEQGWAQISALDELQAFFQTTNGSTDATSEEVAASSAVAEAAAAASSQTAEAAKLQSAAAVAKAKAQSAAANAKGKAVRAAQSRARALSKKRSGSVKGTSAIVPPQAGDMEKLSSLSKKKYVDQAQWFLNAYWNADEITFKEKPEECERVWTFTHNMAKLDKKHGEEGCELDEFEAHIFLEKNIEALTVKKMRQVLKEIDVDFNQKVSLTEFLIFYYKIDYHYLVNAVVDDKESEALIALANEKLAAAQAALEESQVRF